ncbi:dynein beta chain, ciliary isoform X2 [Lingula anatina]|uniref:Dynein beta chain, ciliary isoform X2 n=1 Tax=Lingula anatina TaxID=7574 RepID=A0A1S3IDL2_LINAN|nr:dynein beta chain, ciliary isoform X2 [Lingula anatina]|eukprot:XP_013396327.1 dynein beta chain, ciliary isoform X2 [Lingula anatina]
MASDLELGDSRVEFIADYVLKTMKLKPDKWMKMYNQEEYKLMILEYFDKTDVQNLILLVNSAGVITPQYEWPTNFKGKACYFVKKGTGAINKDNPVRNATVYGDLSHSPLDQLSAFVDEILVPLLSNEQNHDQWPQVVSADVKRHVHNLKSNVYVVAGQVKGKTLLPLPVGSTRVEEAAQEEAKGDTYDRNLVHAIESVIIEWTHQIRDVLKKDSAQPLLEGLNPTPSVEIEFWKAKVANLECIFDQLRDPKVRKMAELLEKTNSSYFPSFKNLFRDVVAALTEAQDINMYLKPLRNHVDDIEGADFCDVKPLLPPLMHVICLIWSNSQFYNTPARIIVVLQEVCNTLINSARNYLDPTEIFKGEVEETIEKVRETVEILKYFQVTYEEHKAKLKDYFKNGDPKEWEFAPQLVFSRYDTFVQRVETVRDLFETALEFMKLEKIELGGIKGRSLSAQVVQIFDEFNELYKMFSERAYDALDPVDTEFTEDYKNFQAKIEDLDRRLGAIICQAFDDCSGLESALKLVDIFGSLLERPIIKEIFDPSYPKLIVMMDEDLDTAKSIYDLQMQVVQQTGKAISHKNMPKVTGGLKWATELRERISAPMENFSHIEHPCMEGEAAKKMKTKYEQMLALLEKFEKQMYDEWTAGVNEACSFNLAQPLLTRNEETKLIAVNFDPQLVAVLREVKYLEIKGQEDIPEAASGLYQRNETYRQFNGNLDLTVQWYNKVRETILEVEYPLIEGQLADIDKQLEKAEKDLNWEEKGAWDYIVETRDLVQDLEQRVQKAKNNVEEIQKLMATWSNTPLFERLEGKHESLLNLNDKEDRLKKRYNEIKTTGEKIHGLVQQNLEFFKADAESDIWKAYVDYVDEMAVDGFFNTIHCSLNFFLDCTDPKKPSSPLFEALMELQVPDMVFNPSLDYGVADGFYDLVDGLVGDIYKQASLIGRLAAHSGQEHYQPDLEEMDELSEMRQELMDRVQTVMNKACEYRNSFDNYAYLWVDDRNEFMRQFLLYGHVLTAEEIEAHADDGVPENPPTLDQFKEQVDTYEKIYEEVEQFDGTVMVDHWFRVNSKPFRQSLLNIIKRWSFMFKQHLIDHVTNSLNELAEFIKVADSGLTKPVEEGDYDGLVECMGHLLAVKDRQASTDEMFEPLKQTIELLKTYGQELPEEVHVQLQELPEQWNNTKKIAITVKQQVAPLQSNEVANIRKKCASFDVQQHTFRENFRQISVYRYSCEDPYTVLDEFNQQITDMEKEMAALLESAGLFEVNVPDYKQLKQCRKEICMLKQLWDYVYIVRTSFDDWKTTPWVEINVEQMDMDCKRFAKDIRGLDKEMRAWDTYSGVEGTVKNMLTSLRAVSELQNPAIRERHWQQLMQATGVKFVMDEDTTLSDLLSLNLHNFEDEVRNIVDKAVKEMSMEKVLKELDVTWATMEFEHQKHNRTGITLLVTTEELIETLEDNQVQLQNMLTSKYIAHFLEEVSGWQKKLSTADQVITIWMEVQRTWSHLESIFIGSEDIRNQLPEDSKRFDGIDTDFKEVVKEVEGTLNCVEATNKPGLYDKLEVIQGQLILCEKALAEYLETKRLAFPRFYFVSSADLLDILSNGNQPELVARHLTKLFDSMAALKFQQDSDGNNLKTGVGMFSKDGEYVDFDHECDCTGQVEVWLNRLLDVQRTTVRHEMTEAVTAYEEKAREQWLFDFPAQVALCGTQIWWTTEVNIAFARLEEGYENALKDYSKKQIQQLNTLITMLIGSLTKQERQKVMTICTIDVHARDVITQMITQKIESGQAFKWLSQLRHRWDEGHKDCFANICDAQFRYSHEYLGNTPRLVITPLTDRCYITLTQSLHLVMSGAPAGPAGTGKTETTKDLGRALGIMVYVFNCSEQMDYKSCGNIYKGLAQSGAWGCFDEFNRISVEVLSVVAVQVKSIQDAIRDKKTVFEFQGETISLIATVGIFITMNPGYAGRTELPENLKALFRPCAMVVPDFELICEIMLVAEGFLEARLLARKFITLYTLCKELLSKQDHYDWGLRAIKSVLVVAGALKRGDPNRPEDQVLMRALRDFNVPKIVTDDLPIFMGLIGDLFPALDVPRKRDPEFEKEIKQATLDLKLQPEDGFILKVVQLQELFDVRHSVFIVGNAGTGKSQVWKTLNRTFRNKGKKPIAQDLNPKAVTNDELFGIINPATREWKDGLFSVIMRDLANLTGDGNKWIVLDGDIDPMWIESLNTVMDDNKVLTLASNERIALTPMMRLLFEISHLKTATPATVSRAGILFINPADLGWNPFVSSWIETREVQSEKANLMILFDKYIPTCLEATRSRFKKITPIAEISHIQMLCYLLEVMLTPENTPPDCPKELYELYFVFCCIWAFGSCMFQDQLVDHRVEFTKWWVTEFKTIKFPSQGTLFDYYIDPETKKFEPWTKKVPPFEFDPEMPMQATLVHTAETTRIRFFMDMLIEQGRPIMLVGTAGTGKTVLMNDKLNSLDTDNWVVANVPFNFYTTSEMLQIVLEKPLEKKAGRNYGPPGSKRLVYFIDDMNMPEVDQYFTVQPHTLIRQHLDYKHWYDRAKLTLKDIHNTQYVSCMNPTSGSFTINPRLQRHFCVFAMSNPSSEALGTIYTSILSGHLSLNGFPAVIQKYAQTLVNGALAMHAKVATSFLPTAIKFHYVFNLRDMSNIFQGLLFSQPDCIKTTQDFVRLWIHESQRVYGDKMIDETDMQNFEKIHKEIVKKSFEDVDEAAVFVKPLIYCHFAAGIGEPKYMMVEDYNVLNKTLVEALDSYNELNAAMNLVLFEDAISHICRINRILESPRGNALLVGVGGSGKQSLSRIAAFISSLEVFQVTLRKGYGIADLKLDLSALYMKAGVKNIGTVFLMTDAQVADEKFLVLINDLLASGEIPGLFPDDELENIINAMRPEVKGLGLLDSRENCWKFFIDRVRRQLKVVLCFSPVGATIRVRARKFPAVVNCTCIDWFHDWPEEALVSVSARFMEEVELLSPEMRESIAQFMAYVHRSVNETSALYLQNERRYNYTTPKSFLEQIALYRNLLKIKNSELQGKIQRLENGLEKLRSTSAQVDDLKAKLAAQEVELAQKNEDANKLIAIVGAETTKVSKEKAIASEEEAKVAVIKAEVTKKQIDCETDLAKAEPALMAAQEALNTLNKNNLTELKSFGAPPAACVMTTAAVMVLLAPGGKLPKDRSWKAAKTMMAKVDGFLDQLINYDKENIPESCLKAVQEYLDNPEFDPDFIRSKSQAAAGLCAWAINIVNFYRIFCDVEPKRLALQAANAELAAATEKLNGIMAKIQQLEEAMAKLTAEFERATNEKLRCQEEADNTNRTISLANRLVGGLASENVRWAESVKNFQEQEKTLPGDVLLITAFVSYMGCFTKKYRVDLMDGMWLPFLKGLKNPIPITPDLDPLSMLTDSAQIATWNNEGLPSDRMSTENATILANCERWPLMIDPQLQGIKWIKTKYGEDLVVVRLGQKGYLDTIERAVSSGFTVLLENIEETVDPVLDAILGRNTIKKGRAIRMGDKEVEYNPQFRLIIHTKLANPHYKPEMQAQTTLVNFTVTRDGLEDQLLAGVVRKERPDLEKLKSDLTKQQNEFTVTLKELEDNLLARLSSAGGNFLGDTALVENLETTKRTASEIEEKVKEAKVTEVQINEAREHYRPAAARASLLYFIMNDIFKIHPMYQFSLKAFSVVFEKAIERAEPAEEVKQRVLNLIDCITYSVFIYTTRGLFEKDKLIFTAQMTFQILQMKKEINNVELDFLLRYPAAPNVTTPVDFLNNLGWGGIKALSAMEDFRNLDRDIEGSAKRWKKFVESECPEKEKFPQEWKNKTSLQKLCMMRALRPDRMSYAVTNFVEEKLGSKYTENKSVPFPKSYEETGPGTPVFFILSPGVDPLKDVEALGKKIGFHGDNHNFHNISLGQGQEIVAEQAMDLAAKEGHWVVLQNVHLVAKWLSNLEKKLEEYGLTGHEAYRVFISAEPAASAEYHIIPQGILESAIKITNEPPTGMFANLHKALDNFNQDTLEMCAREAEFKSILFALCYFHAVVCERRKFGPQGWNRSYPFNTGDLTISVNVLYNYLEANAKVPWEDLRYLFGEIMYGGHITDDWDRKLCRTYLEEYMHPDMLDGELYLAPGFPIPPNSDYKGYHGYIDECLPPESPYLYGLHPNAEIEFLTTRSEVLFRTVFEMQPRDAGGDGGGGGTREEKIKAILDEIVDKLPEEFNMVEIMAKVPVEERTPYVVVAFQECERMSMLIKEIRRSLKELDLGLKGELTITTDMENLGNSLFMDTVPDAWAKRAYPSLMGLTQWYADLLLRVKELESWVSDFQLPAAVWLAGFFNPQSFLTAIMQQMARKNEWPLDRMCLQCDVTKKSREDMGGPPREGAYVHGLFMEGARWDSQAGMIAESRLKELAPPVPVIFIKAIPVDRQDTRNVYECPVYKTKFRGPTFVWTFNLKTREKANKWVLGGVALLLQV